MPLNIFAQILNEQRIAIGLERFFLVGFLLWRVQKRRRAPSCRWLNECVGRLCAYRRTGVPCPTRMRPPRCGTASIRASSAHDLPVTLRKQHHAEQRADVYYYGTPSTTIAIITPSTKIGTGARRVAARRADERTHRRGCDSTPLNPRHRL